MWTSDQLGLVATLWEQENLAETALSAVEDMLSKAIDANPNDKLLLEMLNQVADAQRSVAVLRKLLETMERRDKEELP
jgi:hypothetical protein